MYGWSDSTTGALRGDAQPLAVEPLARGVVLTTNIILARWHSVWRG
ncbi:hypothetical protein PLANPX_3394 [Lacipirellula parvula]|uniref:Uncharacterized protein n=1 Tax=Lacipirellula parvula TaxID=2650471 RepID=A0A5K7XCT3_9BACT|nr:hypothetical protein PLANPX_3394 [Lacipirellula parvula]